MAIDIIAIASGNPINEHRAYGTCLPTGETSYIVVKDAPASCDSISEIESKYDGRFEETIIVGG